MNPIAQTANRARQSQTGGADRVGEVDPRAGQLALLGLVAMQLFIGYEWFMSGLTKVVRGGFPAGLADELREKSAGTVGWYKSFLDGTVIPNGRAFGYLIEIGELAIGVVLIVAAGAWIIRRTRLSDRARVVALAASAVALFGAVLMNINFHLANGSPHPWLIPTDGFDEGLDLDSLLPLLEIVLIVVSLRILMIVWRRMRGEAPADVEAHASAMVQPRSRGRAVGTDDAPTAHP